MVTETRTTPPLLYQPVGGILCLDFVDSVDRTAGEPLRETLASYADLCRWSEQAGSLPRARLRALAREADSRATAAVLARARALREAAYGVFQALSEGGRPPAGDLALVNAELGCALAHRCVAPADGGYALGWADEAELDAPLWPLAHSAAELLLSPDHARIKRCAGERCLWLFLDTTKNGQRRWCDMKVCGNRAKVRAHRRRAARKA